MRTQGVELLHVHVPKLEASYSGIPNKTGSSAVK